ILGNEEPDKWASQAPTPEECDTIDQVVSADLKILIKNKVISQWQEEWNHRTRNYA
ncbi:hypothetical protein HHI36_023713, partial [Cryptolaemus montrouzieri]